MAHDFEKKWRSQDVQLQEDVDFSVMLLSQRVLLGLTKAGFKKPSPIQLESIPVGRFGKDLLVQAKSGTGKTLVFTIIALEMLKRKMFRPQVIVLAPTREIATQICSVIKSVGAAFPKLTCFSFIGGFAVVDDKEKSVTCQIVVGTPGRLKQLIELKCLPTNSVRLLVFDEADQLLEGSFKEDIEFIFNSLPAEKQVIATSATYPARLRKLIFRYFRDPHLACLNSRDLALLGIVHYARVVKYSPLPLLQYRNKLVVLERILKTIKFSQCLLFCNGIQKVEVLHKAIKEWGFSTTYISSAKQQSDRLKAIDRLKHFKCKVLVSSDLTARGIDAENVDLVINFDLSYVAETYLHRVGRAGRYGSIGVAITFINENQIRHASKIEEEASFKMYKLPDPVPVDLIQNPYFGEYLIEKPEPHNPFETDQMSDLHDENKIDGSVANGNDAAEDPNAKIIEEFERISSRSCDESENVSSKPTVTTDKVQECTSENTNSSSKCISDDTCVDNVNEPENNNFQNYVFSELMKILLEVKIRSENRETVNCSEKVTNINLPETGNLTNSDTEQVENENSVILNDSNNLQISNTASTDKICVNNTHETPLCQSTENQSTFNAEKNTHLSSKLTNSIELDDNLKENEYLDCKFNEVNTSDGASAPENKNINSCVKDADLRNTFEHKTSNDLNYTIETFLKASRNLESAALSSTNEMANEGSLLNESSEEKVISASMIDKLKCQKNAYFYKVFKKYQEDKNECSGDKIGEKVSEVTSMAFQNDVLEIDSCALNVVSDTGNTTIDEVTSMPFDNKVLEEDNCSSKVASGEQYEANHTTSFIEKSKFERMEKFSEKPNYESTPQSKSNRQETVKVTFSPDSKPEQSTYGKVKKLFEEVHNSDSSDSDLKEEAILDVLNYSSSEDSEGSESESSSGSSSDTTSVSSSSYEEVEVGVRNAHPCNKFCEKKQNLPFVQSSSAKIRGMEKQNSRYIQSHDHDYCKYQSSNLAKAHCNPLHDSGRNCHPQLSRLLETTRHECRGRHWMATQFTLTHPPPPHPADRKRHPHCSRFSETTTRNLSGERHGSETQHRRGHSGHNCFQPSQHRCHPDTNHHACNQKLLCSQWYDTFYNQWWHLQNMMH